VYDALGRVTDSVDPKLVDTRYAYDRLGRVTTATLDYIDGSTSSATADDDVKSTYAYDAIGELVGYCSSAQVYLGGCVPGTGTNACGYPADRAYDEAEIGPEDVDVVELHDCFSANELITYEALGLAAEGEGHKLVENEDTTYGGRWVVNPSGGLISKGHPLGATGLAQCFELNQQLRGLSGPRQVEGARVALQHNIGLGGACVVAVYRKN